MSQKQQAMTAATVNVSGFLYFPWVLVTDSRKSNLTAMIRVKAPPLLQSSALIHLVVVLHGGGRMDCAAEPSSSEKPSRLDLVKTMEFIRGQFPGDGRDDRVTVVTMEDGVLEMSIDDWISAQKQHERLEAKKGTTALIEGLKAAVGILEPDVERVGCILLLSDAESEFKFDKPDAFYGRLSKFPVHAFGLGNDDPAVLHRIAGISKGTYSSITESGKMMEAIALCLGGLKTVVAFGTCVTIKAENPRSIIKHFKIRIQCDGEIKKINNDDGASDSANISIGVLYADEVKDFIVDVEFTSEAWSRTRVAHLKAQVKYKDSSHEQVSIRKHTLLPLLVTKAQRENEDARDAYESLKKRFPCSLVLKQMIRLDVLNLLTRFVNEFQDPKKQQQRNLGEALQSMWDELKTLALAGDPEAEDKAMKAATLAGGPEAEDKVMKAARVGRWRAARNMDLDLGAIEKDMATMVKRLNSIGGGGGGGGGGSSSLGFIYSWLSSYQMQRVATTGMEPATTIAFLTPEMEAIALKAIREHQLAEELSLASQPQVQDDPSTAAAAAAAVQVEPSAALADDAKLKCAIQLFDKIDSMVASEEAYLDSLGPESQDVQALSELTRNIIHKAAVKAIKDWRTMAAAAAGASTSNN